MGLSAVFSRLKKLVSGGGATRQQDAALSARTARVGTVATELAKELMTIVGSAHVRETTTGVLGWEESSPVLAVAPGSSAEVGDVLRLASERGAVVVPGGGFTMQGLGGLPERADIVLEMRRLSSIDYHPAERRLEVAAGATLARVEEVLSPHLHFLPLEAAQPERATIGGVLATAAGGPLDHGFGGARALCAGIEFVDGDGRLRTSATPLAGNLARAHLLELMVGSLGTFGVIVRATLRTFPRPQLTRTFVAEFGSLEAALAFCDRLLQSRLEPMALELVSPRAQEYLRNPAAPRDPDSYAPAASMPLAPEALRVMVRVAGGDTVFDRYRSRLGAAISTELEGQEEGETWRRIVELPARILARHRNAMIVNVQVQPAAMRAALEDAERVALDQNLLSAAVGRVARGTLVLAFVPLAVDPPSAMQFANAASALRASLPAEASAIVAHCPHEAKLRFSAWGVDPAELATMRALKRVLDPADILNRGRFLV